MKKERLLFLLQYLKDNLIRYMTKSEKASTGLCMALGEMQDELHFKNEEKYWIQDYLYQKYIPFDSAIVNDFGQYKWKPRLIEPRLEFLEKLIAEL